MGWQVCGIYSGDEDSLKFKETKLKDVFIVELEKTEDERGFFARSWDNEIFKQQNLNTKIVQCNISFNKKKGTLRGLHYQVFPYEETKIVRCTRGSVYEVVLDLRIKSKTYKQWQSIELSQDDYKMLYVPEGFALGFQTLKDNTELFYQMSEKYVPKSSRGIHYEDPEFKIEWPLKVQVISERDMSFELFKE